MKEYLVYQTVIGRNEIVGQQVNIEVDTLVRFVKANSKEEAIGKFIVATADIYPKCQKLQVLCDESKDYIRID